LEVNLGVQAPVQHTSVLLLLMLLPIPAVLQDVAVLSNFVTPSSLVML
jgi:hypothetical protein